MAGKKKKSKAKAEEPAKKKKVKAAESEDVGTRKKKKAKGAKKEPKADKKASAEDKKADREASKIEKDFDDREEGKELPDHIFPGAAVRVFVDGEWVKGVVEHIHPKKDMLVIREPGKKTKILCAEEFAKAPKEKGAKAGKKTKSRDEDEESESED